MNLHTLIETCKRQSRTTLRGLIPGRGKSAKEDRQKLKAAFDAAEVDGVRWDKQQGVFIADAK